MLSYIGCHEQKSYQNKRSRRNYVEISFMYWFNVRKLNIDQKGGKNQQ